nr:Mur ligase domain-containing protein [Armatimonadota bacterium]
MKLSELCDVLPNCQRFGEDVEIESLAYDSRAVTPGALFIALRGAKTDGHDFIAQALHQGASALMVDSLHAGWYVAPGISALAVPDTRQTLSPLAAAFYDAPTRALDLIGVTGTNGKTTTTYMIESILRTYGERVGLIGTLGAVING